MKICAHKHVRASFSMLTCIYACCGHLCVWIFIKWTSNELWQSLLVTLSYWSLHSPNYGGNIFLHLFTVHEKLFRYLPKTFCFFHSRLMYIFLPFTAESKILKHKSGYIIRWLTDQRTFSHSGEQEIIRGEITNKHQIVVAKLQDKYKNNKTKHFEERNMAKPIKNDFV